MSKARMETASVVQGEILEEERRKKSNVMVVLMNIETSHTTLGAGLDGV